MIDLIASREDDDVKKYMIKVIASYMKQQYLIWNKDTVAEETIFEDIKTLSGGKIVVPSDIHIGSGVASQKGIPSKNKNKKQRSKKGKR